MPVTQKDIAREVGVSQTVVSDVLQDRPRGRVTPETRRRIFEAADRMGYRRNASAVALRSRKSHQVAYVLAQEEAGYSDRLGEPIVGGVARTLAEAGYRLVLEMAPTRGEAARILHETLASGVCDAGVLRVYEHDPRVWSALRNISSPIVVIGQCPEPTIPSVAHDVPGVVARVLDHLSARGHRRFALVHRDQESYYDRLVQECWEKAITERAEELSAVTALARGRAEGEALLAGWLQAPEPPTALVTTSAHAALGATEALRLRGLRVGAGFDLVVLAASQTHWIFEPGTWFVGTDADAVGRRAAEELLKQLEGGPTPGPIRLLPEITQL